MSKTYFVNPQVDWQIRRSLVEDNARSSGKYSEPMIHDAYQLFQIMCEAIAEEYDKRERFEILRLVSRHIQECIAFFDDGNDLPN